MTHDFKNYSTEQLMVVISGIDESWRTATETAEQLRSIGVGEGHIRGIFPRTSSLEWADQAEQELDRRKLADLRSEYSDTKSRLYAACYHTPYNEDAVTDLQDKRFQLSLEIERLHAKLGGESILW
jgi:hypothetical protein